MKRIIVFAGEVSQAVNFARANGLSTTEYLYPQQPQHIYGLDRGTRFVRVGSWQRHKYAEQFYNECLHRGYIDATGEFHHA